MTTGTGKGAAVVLDELAAVLTAWRDADAKVREWTEARDHFARIVKARLGDAEVGTVAGQPAASWLWYSEDRIDPAMVRRLAPPDLVAACTKTSVKRRFTLVKPRDDSGTGG